MRETKTKMMLGDCLELMKELPDGSADMVLCDLPYGTTDCQWDEVIPFDALWEQYRRVVKQNGAIVLFAAQPFTTALIHSNLKDYRYNWYWKKNNKTGGIFAKAQPMRCIEDVCVFYRRMPEYRPQGLVELAEPVVNEVRGNQNVYKASANRSVQRFTNYPNHLLEFKNDALFGKRYHPTQKPVALLEYLIRTYTSEGDTVLDNCMGSGSTGVACVNTGRSFVGIERDERYFGIAERRVAQSAGTW